MKKQSNKNVDSLKNIKKPHPWRNIGIGLAILFGVIGLIGLVPVIQEWNKFRIIDNQLAKMAHEFEGIGDMGLHTAKVNSCHTSYYGINSEIKCGTYITFTAPVGISRETQREELKKAANNIDIDLNYSKETIDDSEPHNISGDIHLALGTEECGGYWQSEDNNPVEYTVYCRATAQQMLSGYQKQ